MDYFSSILPSSLSAKLLGTLLSLGSLLLGLLIYWRRTDSLHAVWERVWRVVAGSTEVQDPRLRSFMQEMRDLEKFRLIYGLKITNMADMQRLIRWVRRHRLDMSALQKARRWVDIASPDIISPPTNGYFFWNGLGYLLAALLAGSAAFVAASPAILKMNPSGIWFNSDGTTVGHVFRGETFKLDQCSSVRSNMQESFGFSESEVKAICEGYVNGALMQSVSKAQTTQKWLGAVATSLAAIWLTVTALHIRSGKAAQRIKDRVCRAPAQTP
ncbi:Uncharacterised protein [Ralstonia mannitolilytica]|uniref:DUF6216 family protein n=1 Tax=Ralstonia mannitolilytica TaxID=105219 RepID=UPI000E086B14|nr:DUF6216 family protein [Ralstonia mannitolilytica]SUD92374.1 Uncharacterised protein [Ralstonia mannitolilytica]